MSAVETTETSPSVDTNIQPPTTQDSEPTDPESTEVQPKENLNELTLDQVLQVNVKEVDFGDLFPGQILEETIIVINKLASTKVPFKIKINCLTKEFDELDEYVYSMRRPSPSDNFNYNDTFMILLAQKSVSYYKLAIKVPLYKESAEILGSIEITSTECQGPSIIFIPIRARIVLPKLKCEKMVHLKSINMSVIKLYMKTLQRQDFRIALKNLCPVNCVAEPMIMKNEQTVAGIDFGFFPAQVSLTPNVTINFMMTVRGSGKDMDESVGEVKALLVVKIRNSAAIFAYPMIIIMGSEKSSDTSN
jgi:hypothetical protein